jgi:hypothetical protein
MNHFGFVSQVRSLTNQLGISTTAAAVSVVPGVIADTGRSVQPRELRSNQVSGAKQFKMVVLRFYSMHDLSSFDVAAAASPKTILTGKRKMAAFDAGWHDNE